ncbi:hypothetical protein TIFTF001_026747 [Ficus carica]|uniref:Uncharacterized protein n=1 Tax=Ficus carica TaxID=3494 RepID=A0AA88DLT0_FICCA|nr:hypothetical protein TIFTF001_026747 [Ficus carica]
MRNMGGWVQFAMRLIRELEWIFGRTRGSLRLVVSRLLLRINQLGEVAFVTDLLVPGAPFWDVNKIRSVLTHESLAAKFAVEIASSLSYDNPVFEGDAKVVIDSLTSSSFFSSS